MREHTETADELNVTHSLDNTATADSSTKAASETASQTASQTSS